jgi:hypothetical protein
MKLFALILAVVVSSSCNRTKLSVRSEYYSRQNLASYIIDTPDPRKEGSDFGQRLIINWAVPENIFQQTKVTLVLQVRLKNGDDKLTRIVLRNRTGRTFYPIFGKDYTKKGGLQSYLVRLEANGETLARSRHKLWVERVKTGK